jgi:hypothetical protein
MTIRNCMREVLIKGRMSVEPKGEIESPSSASMDGQGRSEGAFTSKKLSHERLKLNVCIDALAFLAFAISESSWVALINTPTADYYSESDLLNREILLGLTRYKWEHLHNHISPVLSSAGSDPFGHAKAMNFSDLL